jgi:hypothetical protein
MTDEEERKAYNSALEQFEQKLLSFAAAAQSSYDKHIVTLSGGALGVTFVLFDKLSNDLRDPTLLALAWVCWTASICFALFSHSSSAKAFQYKANLVREAIDKNENYKEPLHNFADSITKHFNFLCGFLFVFGVILMVFFVFSNLFKWGCHVG